MRNRFKDTNPGVDVLEQKRKHLEILLRSKTFQRSAKLSELLKRLVEPTLAGDTGPLKEHVLGIELFGRPMDWDPQNDSIVRVNVNRLRLILEAYYARQDPLPVRFMIPKGSYAAKCILSATEDFRPSVQQKSNSGSACNRSRASKGRLERTHTRSLHEVRLKRLTYDRGVLGKAAFCPDGESVVYSARWKGEPTRIYWQRIGEKYSRPLGLPPGQLRDVSTTGQLLFTIGEGSIGPLAQAGLSGGPFREIAQGVFDAIWLPDNRNIAAARVEGGSIRVEFPLGNPVYSLSGYRNGIRLSVDPTGKRIAFADNSLGPVDFCIAETSGRVRRISRDWRVTAGILWLTPDRLLLSGARRGSSAIHSLDLDGNEEPIYPTPVGWDLHDCKSTGRILTSCVDSRLHIAFRTHGMPAEALMSYFVATRLVGLTPDARFAVLRDLLGDAGSGNSPILLATLPAGQPVQIAAGYYPQLAPDGSAVICLERTESENTIVVTPIPYGLARRYPLDAGVRYHSAEFSGRPDRLLLHLLDDAGSFHTHIFEPKSGRLSPVPGNPHVTLIAPNGIWGLVPGGPELRLANLETGEIRSVCRLCTGWSPVRWSTSGNEIFIFEPGNDHLTANLVQVNIRTGERIPWITLHPPESVGVYMLAWLDITPDGRSYAYTYQQDLCDLYIVDGLV